MFILKITHGEFIYGEVHNCSLSQCSWKIISRHPVETQFIVLFEILKKWVELLIPDILNEPLKMCEWKILHIYGKVFQINHNHRPDA